MTLRTATLALAVGFLFTSTDFAEARRGNGPPANQDTLSSAEAATLTFMREEEKLARDVYQAMNTLWGMRIFANIAAAEQTHMDRIKDKLDAYGLPDPALGPGVFTDSSLQALYDNLISRGSVSLLEALHVGALIEEVDIADLQIAIAETTHADLQTVYGNLLAGSVNHINAFVRQIANLGVTYEAQQLPQAVVDELVSNTGGNQGRRRRGNR